MNPRSRPAAVRRKFYLSLFYTLWYWDWRQVNCGRVAWVKTDGRIPLPGFWRVCDVARKNRCRRDHTSWIYVTFVLESVKSPEYTVLVCRYDIVKQMYVFVAGGWCFYLDVYVFWMHQIYVLKSKKTLPWVLNAWTTDYAGWLLGIWTRSYVSDGKNVFLFVSSGKNNSGLTYRNFRNLILCVSYICFSNSKVSLCAVISI